MRNCSVVFWPTGKSVEVAKGTILLEAARKAGVFLDAPCGGKGHCGKCKVKVISGLHEFTDSSLLALEEKDNGIRLACRTTVEGDMTVEMSELSQAEDICIEGISLGLKHQRTLNRTMDILKTAGIDAGTSIRILSLHLQKPSIDDNMPDLERLLLSLKTAVGTDKIYYSVDTIKALPGVLRKYNFSVNAALYPWKDGYQILWISGEDTSRTFGLCLDIGTTTVASCLVDISTGNVEAAANSGNLQMQYGADVINRMMFSEKGDGLIKLQRAITEGTINQLITVMRAQQGISKSEIVFSAVAGNTTMSHFLLGVPTGNLRREPYIPAFGFPADLKARDIGLGINPDAPVFLFPNVASYVGGDIVSGVLSSGIWNSDENTLFIDLGTNGEIVLGNRDWMVTCACSAGPAFEGGEISCGMRAAPGAIEEVRIDRAALLPKIGTVGGRKPKGICGSGIIDLISEMFLTGTVDRKGKLVKTDSDRIRFNPNTDCLEYVVVWGGETGDGKDITLNEIDIDNFLRAKGAVYSGVRTLLRYVGLDIMDIDKVIIAGGIGQNLDIENSVSLGLLPDIPRYKYEFIGNSALTGAYACTVSEKARKKTEEIAALMTYIELSADPAYMEEFVGACFLPHTDMTLFPSLSA